MKKTIIAIMTLALAACAAPVELRRQTASGYPEGIFPKTTVEAVKSKLMEACSSNGVLVQEAQSNSVVCGKRMQGTDAFIATMTMGNSYSTPPEEKLRFMLFQSGTGVKVTAQNWVELQMPSGQMKREDLNSNQRRNDIQQLLERLGAK